MEKSFACGIRGEEDRDEDKLRGRVRCLEEPGAQESGVENICVCGVYVYVCTCVRLSEE